MRGGQFIWPRIDFSSLNFNSRCFCNSNKVFIFNLNSFKYKTLDGGCSLMAEREPVALETRVRFPPTTLESNMIRKMMKVAGLIEPAGGCISIPPTTLPQLNWRIYNDRENKA